MTPQVSILLPAFDAESTLATCLRSVERQTETRFTACKAHFLARSFLAGGSEYILWGYGDTGRELRLALARHDRRPRHIVELHPGRIGQRIHGAEVIPPEALTQVPRRPIVVSVAGEGARSQIRGALSEMGFCERTDFVCAA